LFVDPIIAHLMQKGNADTSITAPSGGLWRQLGAAAFSGTILALAMPTPGFWPLAWFGLIPLLLTLKDASTRTAIATGSVAGLVYYGIVLSWMRIFGYLPWAALAAVQSVGFAMFALTAARLAPSKTGSAGYLLVPAAWTMLQWLRSLGPYGFTWASLAHSQANAAAFAQIASVTGPWGLDYIVCAANLLVAQAIANGELRGFAVAAGLFLTSHFAGYGIVLLTPISKPVTRVAIIQGNVKQDVVPDVGYVTRTLDTYTTISRQVACSQPDLIVWPETTLPTPLNHTVIEPRLSALARELRAGLLIGAYDTPGPPLAPSYNAAFSYDQHGRRQDVYHKVHLVPYGEFVPLRKLMPFLKNYAVRDQDVLAGHSYDPIRSQIGKIGVCICFESIFPQIARYQARKGAKALVVLTNDAWFLRTDAAKQHLAMAQLRAIENRRYLVRAAATGISAIVDPFGRTKAATNIFERSIVTSNISLLHTPTIYTQFGDYFAYACTLAVTAAWFARRRFHKSDRVIKYPA